MKDQFANYVIQKLLDVTSGEQRANLVSKITPHLQALKKYSYGKHLASIEKLMYASAKGNEGSDLKDSKENGKYDSTEVVLDKKENLKEVTGVEQSSKSA